MRFAYSRRPSVFAGLYKVFDVRVGMYAVSMLSVTAGLHATLFAGVFAPAQLALGLACS